MELRVKAPEQAERLVVAGGILQQWPSLTPHTPWWPAVHSATCFRGSP